MLSFRKVGSFFKSIRFSRCSEQLAGNKSERKSFLDQSSEQTCFVELSFSDEESRSVDMLNGIEEFDLAAQEFNLIPMLCEFLDENLKNNDLYEVLLHHSWDCALVSCPAVKLFRILTGFPIAENINSTGSK